MLSGIFPSNSRLKGCSWPSISGAVAWSPAQAWSAGEIAKMGGYIEVVFGTKKLWLYYAQGYSLIATDYTQIRVSSQGGMSLSNTNLGGSLRLNLGLGPVPSQNTAALIAAQAFNNLWACNQAWADSPPTTVTTTTFEIVTGDRYHRALLQAESLGAFTARLPVDSAEESDGYWQELNGDLAGNARSDCSGQNPYEALTCGRCGRAA